MASRRGTPEENIQEAYTYFLAHPGIGWKELSKATNINHSTIRHIFKKRWGITIRDASPNDNGNRQEPTNDIQIARFYFNNKRSKAATAKAFQTTKYQVCKALVHTGYKNEVCPAWQKMIGKTNHPSSHNGDSNQAKYEDTPELPQGIDYNLNKSMPPSPPNLPIHRMDLKRLISEHLDYVTSLENTVTDLKRQLKGKTAALEGLEKTAGQLQYQINQLINRG